MNRQGFHIAVKPVSKGKGHSVIAKAAYNSGSTLTDKKTGLVHDYTAKMMEKTIMLVDADDQKTVKTIEKNVAHSVLILPSAAQHISVSREGFWNDIEWIEKSESAQLGVEIDAMFPRGLTAEQRIVLVENYSQTLADRYNVLVDVNIHRPHTHLQKKDKQVLEVTTDNHHAHILLSSREILPDPDTDNGYLLSRRKQWGLWATSERLSKGLNGRGDELRYQRRLWADLANTMLPESLSITEKSYREQGVNQLPTMKLGKSLYKDILKGKRSVIHEYNETISELNQYLKANKLEIDYNDQGRIDTELNTQEFNGIEVAYKKRKPYASIDLNKLTFKSPVKALADTRVLANFMGLANNIALKKKTQRSALLSSIHAIDETLSKQAERAITFKETYEALPERVKKLGLDWGDDIKLMTDGIASIKTQEEIAAIKQSVTLLEQYRQDETKQTTASMEDLKKQLETIEQQTQTNEAVFKEITPRHRRMVKAFNSILALKTPFDKQLRRAEKVLKTINHAVIEKEINADRWQQIFGRLVGIKVTDNMKTYHKYQQLGDYDVEALKQLEREQEQLKRIKAAQIDDKVQEQLDTLLLSITDYNDKTNTELKALKQQVNTATKTYQRLEPLFTRRQQLLDTQAPVIEKDDKLYQEITTTKTTQLNADMLDDWQQRVDLLPAHLMKAAQQAALIKQANEQHQAELKRQAKSREQKEQQRQAQQKLQEEQQRQVQYHTQQIQAYDDRISAFQELIAHDVRTIDFKAIDAPSVLIDSAERLALTAMLLDGLQHIDGLTSRVQQDSNNALIKSTETTVTQDTDTFISQLAKLADNRHKIEIIEQLHAKFSHVLDLQAGNRVIEDLQVQLQAQQRSVQHSMDSANANRYSSPRP